MSNKVFCDNCKNEFEPGPDVEKLIQTEIMGLSAFIRISFTTAWDLCETCILKIAKDRIENALLNCRKDGTP